MGPGLREVHTLTLEQHGFKAYRPTFRQMFIGYTATLHGPW